MKIKIFKTFDEYYKHTDHNYDLYFCYFPVINEPLHSVPIIRLITSYREAGKFGYSSFAATNGFTQENFPRCDDENIEQFAKDFLENKIDIYSIPKKFRTYNSLINTKQNLQQTRSRAKSPCACSNSISIQKQDPFTDTPIFHLGVHIWPVKNKWNWHADKLNELAELINGKLMIGIALDKHTDNLDSVQSRLSNKFEIFSFPNNPIEGENITFRKLLNDIPKGENDVLLYCHSKGVRPHTADSKAVRTWSELMYETVIFNHEKIIDQFSKGFQLFGSFRTYSGHSLPSKYDWHYSGTFFAVRTKYIKLEHTVQNGYGGVEIWPGQHFSPKLAYNEFSDNSPLGGQYIDNIMYPPVVNEGFEWEVNRIGGPRCEQHLRELEWFLPMLSEYKNILVIGSREGGLEYQIKKEYPDIEIVSVDIEKKKTNTAPLFIHGNSTHKITQDKIRQHGPFDVVFIDGDHSYNGAKLDWEFSLSLKPKLIAFHDIAKAWKNDEENSEVSKLWGEIKLNYNTEEKIVGCGWGGIGVVHMQDKPSMFSQLVSFTKAVTKHVAHGLKPAKPETQEKRALICSECPELIKETFRCGKCGCFLKYKIAWSTTSCPIDKWKEEEEDE